MKNTFILLLTVSLISCGDSSTKEAVTFSEPSNFSASKYNEDLIGKFYLPEMNNVITQVSEISKDATKENFQINENLKNKWRSLASSYQRIWPLNHATLDRDPEVSEEISIFFISGSYSYSSCRLQARIAEKSHFKGAFRQDSGINLLEFLIFESPTSQNFCNTGSTPYDAVEAWLLKDKEEKDADLYSAIHFAGQDFLKKLEQIRKSNETLYKSGKSDLILSKQSTQKAYDSLVIFVDTILKDEKTAQPLGLNSVACPFAESTCPSAVEHQASGFAFNALAHNLEGVMAIYNQNVSMSKVPLNKGLFQYLIINDKKAVAQKVYNNILEAYKITISLKGQSYFSLATKINNPKGKDLCRRTTVRNNLVPVCALYRSIKSLSDLLKVDLRLALALSTTAQVEGDSD